MIIITVLHDDREWTPGFPISKTADNAVQAIWNCCHEEMLFSRAIMIGDVHADVTANILELFFEAAHESNTDIEDMIAPRHRPELERFKRNIEDENADIDKYGSVQDQASADYRDSR